MCRPSTNRPEGFRAHRLFRHCGAGRNTAEIIARLNAAVVAALNDPEVARRIRTRRHGAAPTTMEAFPPMSKATSPKRRGCSLRRQVNEPTRFGETQIDRAGENPDNLWRTAYHRSYRSNARYALICNWQKLSSRPTNSLTFCSFLISRVNWIGFFGFLISLRRQSSRRACYVQARAAGHCEGCKSPAPFARKNGAPYLEPHHIRRVSDGGPDDPAFVISLCPNCHRRVLHAGADGDDYNAELLARHAVDRAIVSCAA